MRRTTVVAILLAGIAAACGTPEIAREHEQKVFLPRELDSALRSEDPALRADAANQVASMPAEERQAVLLSLLDEDRPHVRLLAVGLIARHHASNDEAVAALADVLSLDPDIDVRMAAVAALANSTNPKALAVLVGVLTDDPSLLVKRQAAEALDGRTGQTFGAALVERLDAAEEAADETMMAYDEWFESRGAGFRWDDATQRFVGDEG